MSSPWAEAEVKVVLDFDNLDTELRARVERAVAIATRAAEQHFRRLERTATQSADRTGQAWERAGARVERSAAAMERGVSRRFAGMALDAQRNAARMSNHFESAFAGITLDSQRNASRMAGHYRDSLDSISDRARTLRAELRDPIRIHVTPDGLQTTTAQIRRAAEDRHSTIHVNTRGDFNAGIRGAAAMANGVGRLGGALGSMGSTGLSALGTLGKFGGLAGAAVIAVGALVPVVGALASALVSVGVAGGGAAAAGLSAALVGVGALKAGLSGIGDALGAINETPSGGGGGGVDAAEKAHQVEQAQKALSRAVRDEKAAQLDVAAARKTAQERLEDLNLEMRGAALSERDAVLSLREAQADLAKGGFQDANERDRAILRVDEAEQRLAETRERNKDLADESADAERKGIEGSDEVVAAKQKLADATDQVKEAQYQLNQAQKDTSAGGGGVDKLGEAMAKLAPNARDFVQTLIDLQPAWTAVQQRVQNRLFAGLGDDVRALAGNYLPSLASALIGAVAGFNDGARSALGFVNSARGMSVVNTLLTQSSTIAGNFGRTLGNLVPGFAAIGASASNVFAPMSAGISAAAADMSEKLVQAQQSGRLDETFKKALDVAKQLGAVLGEIGGIIGGIFRAASAAGDGNGLANITNSLSTIGDFVNSPAGQGALTSFFQAVGAAVSAVLPVLMQLVQIIGTDIAPIIANLLTQIGPMLEPLLTALGQGIQALAPAVGPLAEAFGAIASALTPIMPILGELIATFVQLAGPIIGALAEALGPILATVGTALIDILRALQPAIDPIAAVFAALSPVISQIAGILGELLVGAITALMPLVQAIAEAFVQLLPALQPLVAVIGDALMQLLSALGPIIAQVAQAWLQVVSALIPLIPMVTQIVAAILPPLVDIIAALLPLMSTMAIAAANILVGLSPIIGVVAQLITWFAQLLGTIIGWGASALGAVVDFATGVITWFSELPGRVIGFVVDMWGRITGAVRDGTGWVVEQLTGLPGRITGALGGLWNGLTDTFRSAINWIIQKWNSFRLEAKIPDGVPLIGGKGFTIETPDIPLFNQGGQVPMLAGAQRGRDSILAGIAPGEYIEPADRVNGRTLPILDAIRAGWVPSAAQLSTLLNTGALPGYVGGGLVSVDQLTQFAQGVEGAVYDWGGVHWGDCSGAVSAVANYATGRDPFGSRFATGSEEGELAARGFKPGLGPAGSLNIGWFNGGPYGGHTAATLPNGVNFEMGGARGDGQYGGGAAGANDPQFTDHAHLPPEHFVGLDGGSPTTGSGGGAAGIPMGGGGIPGASGGGGSTPGGSGGSGGSSSSGGAGNVVRVEVINWPGTYSAGGGIPPATGGVPPATGGVSTIPGATGTGVSADGGTTSASMPFGPARAQKWLGEQEFGEKARGWGVDAIKEIGGGVLAPIGADSLFTGGVDRIVDAIKNQPQPGIKVEDKTRGGVSVSGTPNTRTTYRG